MPCSSARRSPPATVEELLRGYTTLTREDIAAALAYGAKLAHERILPLARTS